jgi:1-acyl-sn-glycerol-3-phosphate acyltransferase
MLLVWLPIICSYACWTRRGGWDGIKRVSFCTRYWGASVAWILGIKVKVTGDADNFSGGLIVSNHLGYIDVFVHASLFPIRFTPKADIRKWPLLGHYVGVSRPIWIDRSSRHKSHKTAKEFEATMAHGIPLLVYPEGTSTDGLHGVLPFKSTAFESVTDKKFPILPILITYKPTEDGKPVAWYGDMTMLPHLWRVLGYRSITAEVHILPQVVPAGQNRKELAAQVHKIMAIAYSKICGKADISAPKGIV